MGNFQKRRFAGPKEFIALMAILMSVVAVSIDGMLPALGIIGEDLGVTHPNQAQYIISFIFGGMAVGQLINGPLSDALGRKKVLYISLSVYVTGSLLCLLAGTIEIMLLGRFIQGIGVSGPYISIMSIVRDRYSGREMARIMSLVMTIFIMVPVIAPALGQGILLLASWHYIFALYIVYALGISIWIFFRLEETHLPQNRIPYKATNIIHGAKKVLSNRITLSYTLALGCIFGALMGDLNSIQQIFQVQYGVGEMFAVYFGLQALAFGVASFANSLLVGKLGMRLLCLYATAGIVAASAAMLLLGVVVPLTFPIYFIYGVVLLFCVGILFGNINALAMEPMGHIAGIAAAIIGATSSIMGNVLGTTIGQLYNGTITPILLGFSVLGALAFMFMFYERSHLQSEQAANVATKI